MFFHIFKYQLKLKLRDKIATFWSLAFPVILAILFSIAFSNMMAGEKFEKIDIAVVSNFTEETTFYKALTESNLFNIEILTSKEADSLLALNKIDGYITEGEELSITVSKSGINQSILKEFVDTYERRSSTITNIVQQNPQILETTFVEEMSSMRSYTSEEFSGDSTDLAVIFFYTLIAMVSLLGANFGSDDIINIQGNQSPKAARVNVAPENKLKIFFPSLCASMVYHFSIVFMYILFIRNILKVDFGTSLGPILLLAFVACFTAISMGTMLSALINKKQSIKTAIILIITMLGTFLSGMMAVQVKYLVQKYVPIISYINPANLITDGLYSLYYYENFNRYFLNLGILGCLGLIFTIITYFVLRRQQYASI